MTPVANDKEDERATRLAFEITRFIMECDGISKQAEDAQGEFRSWAKQNLPPPHPSEEVSLHPAAEAGRNIEAHCSPPYPPEDRVVLTKCYELAGFPKEIACDRAQKAIQEFLQS